MNQALRFTTLVIFIVSGCGNGDDACEAFNSAQRDCYSTLGADPEFIDDCTDTPKEEGDRYDCLADLYNNAECSSSETMPTEEEADACE